MRITSFDRTHFRIDSTGFGEAFTYSDTLRMDTRLDTAAEQRPIDSCRLQLVGVCRLRKHHPGTEIKAITYSAMQLHEKDGRADVYVIVDI